MVWSDQFDKENTLEKRGRDRQKERERERERERGRERKERERGRGEREEGGLREECGVPVFP